VDELFGVVNFDERAKFRSKFIATQFPEFGKILHAINF